jgi:hypothetical protein
MNEFVSISARMAPPAVGLSNAGGHTPAELVLAERVREYLAAIEAGTDPEDPASAEDVIRFYHPDIRQEELPNRLVPQGATRGLEEIREAARRGGAVLRGQRYAVRSVLVRGAQVAMETLWVGTLAVAVGDLAPGSEMIAHFAMFLHFEGQLIRFQRNYDCFRPF